MKSTAVQQLPTLRNSSGTPICYAQRCKPESHVQACSRGRPRCPTANRCSRSVPNAFAPQGRAQTPLNLMRESLIIRFMAPANWCTCKLPTARRSQLGALNADCCGEKSNWSSARKTPSPSVSRKNNVFACIQIRGHAAAAVVGVAVLAGTVRAHVCLQFLVSVTRADHHSHVDLRQLSRLAFP